MKTDWRIELALLLLIAAMFAGAALVWPSAPDSIPVHWNASGDIDRYGGKFEGLFLLPLFALGLYFLMRYIPRIDPGRANYARFGGAYTAIRAGIVLLMAVIHLSVLLWTQGRTIDMAAIVPFAVGALFLLVGAVLGKVRPNWFVGVRTPWTLSSKQSWVRTHRLGGWLFMALGLLFLIVGATGFETFGKLVIGAVITVVVVLFVYSYFAWRADPDKQPPAGTQPADDE